MVNVFTYLDYRHYLKDVFAEHKKEKTSFSHRMFSRIAGFKSSNFILLVMQGKRNVSSEAIIKIAKALKLKKSETEFFEHLVRFNQSKTESEKKFYYERLSKNREYAKAKPMEVEHYNYYSKWYVPVVREMVLLEDFCEDHKWISKRIRPQITEAEAKEAMEMLFEMGLISRGEDGRLIQSDAHIYSGDEVKSLAVANYQRKMIELAGESLEKLVSDNREIGSITFAVSKGGMKQARTMIREFRSRLAGFLAKDESAEDVYQFNIQLFNLSAMEGGKDD